MGRFVSKRRTPARRYGWWSPTAGRACRRTISRTSSSSSIAAIVPARAMKAAAGWGSALPSESCSPTAAASGPRASWEAAPRSPSLFRKQQTCRHNTFWLRLKGPRTRPSATCWASTGREGLGLVAAAAATAGIRVLDREAAPHQAVAVVDLGALQQRRGLTVGDNANTRRIEYVVFWREVVVETHAIVGRTATAAAGHENANGQIFLALLIDKALQLRRR